MILTMENNVAEKAATDEVMTMKKTILVFAAAMAAIAFCVFAKVNRDRKGEMRTERAKSSDVAELTVTDPPISEENAETVGEVTKSTGEGPLDRLLRAIVDGDAKTVAKSVLYPFDRKYPIPPVQNEEEFVARFDDIFDRPFRRMLGELLPEAPWEEMGWRGVMLGEGPLWIDGTISDGGNIYALNYQSEAEQELSKQLVEEERRTLPPNLANEGCDPKLCFETEDGKIAGRVDDIGNDHFRVALFAMPFHPGDQPAATFRGRAVWEGSGGNHTYLDDEGLWALEVNVIGALDTPDFHLLERDSWADAFDLGAARPARKSLWPEIVAKGAL